MNYSRFLLIILSILVYVSFFSIVNAQENPVGFEMHRDLAAVLGAPLNETGPQMVWLPEESVFLAGTVNLLDASFGFLLPHGLTLPSSTVLRFGLSFELRLMKGG